MRKFLVSCVLACGACAAACSSNPVSTTGGGGSGGDGSGASGGGGAAGGCPVEVTVDDLAPPVLHTPRWAFEPWISKDISDDADTRAFVAGFEERSIPVGVVVLDSPWETNYNTFIPNPSRYPDFDKLVSDLAAKDIRVVLWITPLVNTSSFDLESGGDFYEGRASNYDEGAACGFYVNDAQTYTWWKGKGSSVDFFNPQAAAWWHHQQDALFDLGVSGFKLDFGESYITGDTVMTADGEVSLQAYSERYYEDFLTYGQHKRGKEDFVTMVRPWDESYGFEGRYFARPEHAPVAWVGDNRRDFIGLEDALFSMWKSAVAGYGVLGSDIGGYLDRDDKTFEEVPENPIAFARWTAVGALSPFMELHGRANLAPWTVADKVDEIVALYRYYSVLHHEMVPYWYSLSESAAKNGEAMLHPQGDEASWMGDQRYVIGEALLVAPILDATGVRDVELPGGASWYDYWDLGADPLSGGQLLPAVDATDLAKIPLYFREGAIVPLDVSSDLTGFGAASSAGHLTVLVFPSTFPSSFELIGDDGATATLSAELGMSAASVTLSRTEKPTLVRVRVEQPAFQVVLGGQALTAVPDFDALTSADSGYWADDAGRAVWVKVPMSPDPSDVIVSF